jgi:membrane protein
MGEAWAIQEAWRAWRDEGGTRQGAALAFYALFAAPPLVFLLLRAVGAIYGEAGVIKLAEEVAVLVGDDIAAALAELSHDQGDGLTLGSIGALVYAILRGGLHLQGTINQMWGVAPTRGPGFRNMLHRRLMALSSVGVTAGALVASFVVLVGVGLAADQSGVQQHLWTLWFVNELGAFTVAFVAVALLYRILPDARIAWRDIAIGALTTAALLTAGRSLVAMWVTHRPGGASHAASASIAVLVYAYYGANNLVLGAKVTAVIAERNGRPILPGPYAAKVVRTRVEPDLTA